MMIQCKEPWILVSKYINTAWIFWKLSNLRLWLIDNNYWLSMLDVYTKTSQKLTVLTKYLHVGCTHQIPSRWLYSPNTFTLAVLTKYLHVDCTHQIPSRWRGPNGTSYQVWCCCGICLCKICKRCLKSKYRPTMFSVGSRPDWAKHVKLLPLPYTHTSLQMFSWRERDCIARNYAASWAQAFHISPRLISFYLLS